MENGYSVGFSMRSLTVMTMLSWLAVAEAASAEIPTWTASAPGSESDWANPMIGSEGSGDFFEDFAQRLQVQRMTGSWAFDDTEDSWQNAIREENRRQEWLWDGSAGWNPWIERFDCSAHWEALIRLADDDAGNDPADDWDHWFGKRSDLEISLRSAPELNLLSNYSVPLVKPNGRRDGGRFTFCFQCDSGNRYVSKRQISLGTFSETLAKKPSFAKEFGLSFRGGTPQTQPYQGLEYLRLEQGAVSEKRSDLLALSVGTDHASALRCLLGSRIQSRFRTETGCQVTVEGRAAWRHEFLAENEFLDAAFSGLASSSLTILASDIHRNAAIFGPGLTLDLNKSLRFCARYDVLLNGDSTIYAGSGGVESVW